MIGDCGLHVYRHYYNKTFGSQVPVLEGLCPASVCGLVARLQVERSEEAPERDELTGHQAELDDLNNP